jgi:hypothetical protein
VLSTGILVKLIRCGFLWAADELQMSTDELQIDGSVGLQLKAQVRKVFVRKFNAV